MLQEPIDLPGGRLAVIADPAGAVLAVITSAPEAEALQRGTPGGQCWTEALSRDAGAARAFCSAAVPGREAVTDPPSDLQDGRFAVVEDPRGAAFGLSAPQPGAG